jgi:hypothetical protein
MLLSTLVRLSIRLGYESLMTKWEMSLPMTKGGFDRAAHVALLSGIALPQATNPKDAAKEGGVWRYYPECELPREPASRFGALFEVQSGRKDTVFKDCSPMRSMRRNLQLPLSV